MIFEDMAATIARRHSAIRRAVTPLPGSQPRHHLKPLNIPARCDGLTLLAALERMVGNVSAPEWQAEFAAGLVVNLKLEPVAPMRIVRAGERYQHLFPNVTEPAVNGAVEILHENQSLIVVNKPAPLPMHAGGRYHLNTLQHLLNAAYSPETPYPAHRLDANTTGLLLVARTRAVVAGLHRQFALGRVEKTYLVLAQGQPPEDLFTCDAPIGAAAGERCMRTVDLVSGKPARTEFQVAQRHPNGTTLLEARPLTGRTHQIRVHLWHLGLPVCGDPIYSPGKTLAQRPLDPGTVPLCLHAWRIKFAHPVSQEPMNFTAPPPIWAKD